MKPGLRFLYLHTDDLSAARHFYSNLLGMDEFYFQEGDSVAYRCDALQFSIMLTKQPLPRPQGWATQPGWAGDTAPHISWSVECSPADFRMAVSRLRASGVESLHPLPQWQGYWSFVVHDPMGNTVELSDPSSDESTSWKGLL